MLPLADNFVTYIVASEFTPREIPVFSLDEEPHCLLSLADGLEALNLVPSPGALNTRQVIVGQLRTPALFRNIAAIIHTN